ncbi:MAG: preprotein translocase subunit SecA, partial [Cyclobacteriaceae bacterium]|nr:preprotein translocase subunit SecA [Cyclobacteriaceae bacterium]
VRAIYLRKEDQISKQAFPVIKDVFEKQGKVYENIVVPIADGSKIYQIVTNLEKAYRSQGEELLRSFEKTVVLANIDDTWKEHLRELDELKQSVQNASYEQKDPLLIYKFESFELFKSALNKINREVVGSLLKGQLPLKDSSEVRQAQAPRRTDMSRLQAQKSEFEGRGSQGPIEQGANQERKVQPVRVEKKVGRNEPCPCGSGKKFKNCHGTAEA